MEQQQSGEVAPPDEHQDPPSPPSRSDNDDTWGLGSASALDYLRRRNFRGSRSPNADDRPNAD